MLNDKMILPKFSKRERTLLFLTILIVVSAVSYGFIIEPTIEAYSRLNRQIEAGILRLQKNYKLIKRQDIIKSEYEKYANFIKGLPSDEEEIASMLKAIEAIARENNIYITNIRPQPVKDKVFYKELVFELVVDARIDRLVKFIYDLHTSENLLRVARLTLSPGSSKEEALKAVMEISKPSVR